MFGMGFPEVLIVVVVLAFLVFDLYMFIQMLMDKRFSVGMKILWTITMILFGPFTHLFYFFVFYLKPGYGQRCVDSCPSERA